MAQTTLPDFYVGALKVQPRLNQVVQEGTAIRLAPKFMQVFVYLAERPGQVVTREELLDTVWEGTVVGEAVLTRSISALRKVFKDDPQNPQVIETILKSGYRFIGPITFGDGIGGDSSDGHIEVAVEDVIVVPSPDKREGALAVPRRRSQWLIPVAVMASAVSVAALLYAIRSPERVLQVTPPQPLTSLEGEEFDPSFSPDGKQVAFAWQTGGETDIYIKTIATQQTRRLTTLPVRALRPAWSPDGRYVAYVRCGPDAAAIEVTPAEVGLGQHVQPLALTNCEDAPRLAWSPDGHYLAYAERPTEGGPKQIVLLALETGAKTVLTSPDVPYHSDVQPTFSPDGQRLAFARGGAAGRDVYSIAVTGGAPTQHTFGSFMVEGLDWMPDGEDLVFASRGNLWRVATTGGVPQRLQQTSTHIFQPAIARQGGRMAFAQATYDVNIWRVPVQGNEFAPVPSPEKVIASTRIDGDPRISPDGQRIAFISDREGVCGLWVADARGQHVTPLVTEGIDCMRMAMPQWSPDGTQVAYIAYPDGEGDIFTVNTVNGAITRVTDETSSEEAPTYAPDGQWLYFSSNRTGSWQIWRVPITGGAAEQVTTNGGYYAQASPNDKQVYYTHQGQDGLWVRDLSTGTEREVLAALHSDDGTNWRIADRGIYYVKRHAQAEAPVLAFLNRETAQETTLTALPFAHSACVRFDLAPDAVWAVFARVDYGGSDLALVEHTL